jgi:hypothetical protein
MTRTHIVPGIVPNIVGVIPHWWTKNSSLKILTGTCEKHGPWKGLLTGVCAVGHRQATDRTLDEAAARIMFERLGEAANPKALIQFGQYGPGTLHARLAMEKNFMMAIPVEGGVPMKTQFTAFYYAWRRGHRVIDGLKATDILDLVRNRVELAFEHAVVIADFWNLMRRTR